MGKRGKFGIIRIIGVGRGEDESNVSTSISFSRDEGSIRRGERRDETRNGENWRRGMIPVDHGRIPETEITEGRIGEKDGIRSDYNSCQKKPGSRLLT